MVGDILNLIAHFILEIKFYITFISNTFLIRLTVYEILRVFVCVCLCLADCEMWGRSVEFTTTPDTNL